MLFYSSSTGDHSTSLQYQIQYQFIHCGGHVCAGAQYQFVLSDVYSLCRCTISIIYVIDVCSLCKCTNQLQGDSFALSSLTLQDTSPWIQSTNLFVRDTNQFISLSGNQNYPVFPVPRNTKPPIHVPKRWVLDLVATGKEE